jgi:hypothetical protein
MQHEHSSGQTSTMMGGSDDSCLRSRLDWRSQLNPLNLASNQAGSTPQSGGLVDLLQREAAAPRAGPMHTAYGCYLWHDWVALIAQVWLTSCGSGTSR